MSLQKSLNSAAIEGEESSNCPVNRFYTKSLFSNVNNIKSTPRKDKVTAESHGKVVQNKYIQLAEESESSLNSSDTNAFSDDIKSTCTNDTMSNESVLQSVYGRKCNCNCDKLISLLAENTDRIEQLFMDGNLKTIQTIRNEMGNKLNSIGSVIATKLNKISFEISTIEKAMELFFAECLIDKNIDINENEIERFMPAKTLNELQLLEKKLGNIMFYDLVMKKFPAIAMNGRSRAIQIIPFFLSLRLQTELSLSGIKYSPNAAQKKSIKDYPCFLRVFQNIVSLCDSSYDSNANLLFFSSYLRNSHRRYQRSLKMGFNRAYVARQK